MSVVTRTGHTLLNPSEKREKYFVELMQGVKRTNNGSFKLDENKKAIHLTPEQRAYRSGYIAAQNDSAKCYNSKHGKRK